MCITADNMAKITVQNTQITVLSHNDKDYISLTDMANGKQSDSRAADIIKKWLRNRYTIEFLGTWEMIHNPTFKVVEFDNFRMQAGLPSFVLSASEWIEKTNRWGRFSLITFSTKPMVCFRSGSGPFLYMKVAFAGEIA